MSAVFDRAPELAPSRPADEEFEPVFAAARGIVSRLAATASRSEHARSLHADAVALLREAGLARLMKPRAFGGCEASVRAQVWSCYETAQGCSAASWVQMVCGAHDFVLGGFPDQCLDEVFGADPDLLVAGTLAPQGTVARATGGWRLNGRWQFCSGVDHSPWLMFGARQTDVDTDPSPWGYAHLMVSKADIEVDDTWHVLGMRGTGSKDVVAHDVFVPLHRTVPTPALFTGVSPHVKAALYHLPVMPVLSSMLCGSVLGIAERGYADYVGRTRLRSDQLVGGAKALHMGLQRRVAEARLELDAAHRLLHAMCERMDAFVRHGIPPVPPAMRVKMRLDAAYVVQLCRRAIDRVFEVAGAHALYDTAELQRVHRDLHTASHHAIADFDVTTEAVGKTILGIDLGPAAAIS